MFNLYNIPSVDMFAKENFERLKENFKENGFDVSEAQQKLADYLGIGKKADVMDILMRCYRCTKRERYRFTV
jgi:hypothetical protein